MCWAALYRHPPILRGVSASQIRADRVPNTKDPDLPIQRDLREEVLSGARLEARRRIAELQQMVGTDVPVRVAVGSVKRALLEAALEADADVLMIGRSHERGAHGRMRDLTYAMVRDSSFPVLGV